VYYLQAGAFREMSDAEATRAKLALLGFEAAISDRTSDSGVLHRVRVGPYSQVAVNKARAKLLDSGMVVDVVRTQR
jgi:cell division protein FtsN